MSFTCHRVSFSAFIETYKCTIFNLNVWTEVVVITRHFYVPFVFYFTFFVCGYYILNAIENASSILDIHITYDINHGSPGDREYAPPFQFK